MDVLIYPFIIAITLYSYKQLPKDQPMLPPNGTQLPTNISVKANGLKQCLLKP